MYALSKYIYMIYIYSIEQKQCVTWAGKMSHNEQVFNELFYFHVLL